MRRDAWAVTMAYLRNKARISRAFDTLEDANEQAIAPLCGDGCGGCPTCSQCGAPEPMWRAPLVNPLENITPLFRPYSLRWSTDRWLRWFDEPAQAPLQPVGNKRSSKALRASSRPLDEGLIAEYAKGYDATLFDDPSDPRPDQDKVIKEHAPNLFHWCHPDRPCHVCNENKAKVIKRTVTFKGDHRPDQVEEDYKAMAKDLRAAWLRSLGAAVVEARARACNQASSWEHMKGCTCYACRRAKSEG